MDTPLEQHSEPPKRPPSRRVLQACQVVLAAVMLLLLAGVIPVPEGGQAAVLRSPLMVLAGLSLVGMMLRCRWRRRLPLGSGLLHGGLVVLLTGAGLSWWGAQQGLASVPLDGVGRRIELSAGITLGTALAARNFVVEYEAPMYHLYRHNGRQDVVHLGTYPIRHGMLDLGGQGQVPERDLRQEDGTWREFHRLPPHLVLQRGRASPRHYSVQVQVDGDDWQEIRVNHPVTAAGWRFHLVNWEQDDGIATKVQLSARKDPGRSLVILGIWLTILGSVIGAVRILKSRP